jgi:hypothetical protein
MARTRDKVVLNHANLVVPGICDCNHSDILSSDPIDPYVKAPGRGERGLSTRAVLSPGAARTLARKRLYLACSLNNHAHSMVLRICNITIAILIHGDVLRFVILRIGTVSIFKTSDSIS